MKLTPLEPILRRNLLSLARTYADIKGQARGRPLKMATVSKYVYGDEPFLDNLPKGNGFNIRKYDEAIDWFYINWPVGHTMPSIKYPVAPRKKPA